MSTTQERRAVAENLVETFEQLHGDYDLDRESHIEAIDAALATAHAAGKAEGRREGIEDAAKKVEDHGHSNGRIRASHKHLAKAIRALLPRAPE